MTSNRWLGWGAVPLVLGVAGTLAYAAFLAAGQPDSLLHAANWSYNGALAMAGVVCLVQALRGAAPRGPFIAFGIGLLLWAAADVYYTETFQYTKARDIPYPSWADVGFLASLPFFFAGIALLIRQRVGRFTLARWFDGAIGVLAASALATALVSPALVGIWRGETDVVLTNVLYPLLDLLLIAFITGALVVTGVRGARGLIAVGAGLLIWSAGDAYYLYLVATNSYDGGIVDMIWPIGALIIALGAFMPTALNDRRHAYRSPIFLPVIFGLVALTVLIWDHFDPVEAAAVWLAAATILAVLVRLGASFSENNELMRELHLDSITDALTGLGNRRALSDRLAVTLESQGPSAEPHMFAIYDLDGFKFYNDSFGHPAGDLLLRRLGTRLARAVGSAGAFRLGGDEFCVFVPLGTQAPDAIAEAGREALSERGEGFTVGASCGWALVPEEATSASKALRIVDKRMYAEKATRSVRNVNQMQEIFRRIFQQQDPELQSHFEGVARLAREVARELQMDAEAIDAVGRAAELHDLGKIAMPEEMLEKPGALDHWEWELMRRHTVIGDRILSATPAMKPVARIVRWSHERWDGKGYPDGLRGEQIPLPARLIAVCDAFVAMTSDRPYQARRSVETALAELRGCAGTQFDPDLVEVFCRVVGRAPADYAHPRPAAAL